jgi:hypothetical protein
MESPLLRIETDGEIVEVYIEGEKVHELVAIEFKATRKEEIYCELEQRNRDAEGKIALNQLYTDIQTIKTVLLDNEKVEMLKRFPFKPPKK